MLSLPFGLVGGMWLMWWLEFNMSVAVAVGFIALAGVAAQTGVVMLIYLDHATQEAGMTIWQLPTATALSGVFGDQSADVV